MKKKSMIFFLAVILTISSVLLIPSFNSFGSGEIYAKTTLTSNKDINSIVTHNISDSKTETVESQQLRMVNEDISVSGYIPEGLEVAVNENECTVSRSSIVTYNLSNGETETIEIQENTTQSRMINEDISVSGYIPEGLEIAEIEENYRAIIGTDDRKELTNVNVYPYSTICHLDVYYNNGTVVQATGTLIGKNIVATSGHLVYRPDLGWTIGIKVTPGGRRGNAVGAWGTYVSTVKGWVDYADIDYDYAVIEIDSNLGNSRGYMGYQSYSLNSSLSYKTIYNYGFPVEKTGNQSATMWYSDNGTITNVYSRYVHHTADTTGGHSGSPIVLSTAYDQIVAIHSMELNSTANGATRVTSAVVSFFNSFK